MMFRSLITGIDTFFFRRISASGFGLMRLLWGFTAFAYLLMQWSDVTEFYSNAGILPTPLTPLITRSVYHFTLLQWITTPEAVFTLYLLLLFTLACAAIGLSTRLMTITATVLLFSFHERNPFTLGGGDTVLRHIGFLLCIAPGLCAFSLDRLEKQWKAWKRTGRLLAPLRMSIWPYRLLLWQMIVIYGTSLWFKSLGTMWWQGTAVGAALHHPTFVRLPLWMVDLFIPLTPFVDIGVLAFHALWLTLLVPQYLWSKIPLLGSIQRKRLAIGLGLLFHGSILFLMDAGSFSPAVFSAYLGLLLEEDFIAISNRINLHWQGKIAVLYDGKCGLCQRSVFLLTLFDHLRRLRCIDYWKKTERKAVAPHLTTSTLNRAMHVVFPQGVRFQVLGVRATGRKPRTSNLEPKTYKGFDGFRELAANLPFLWLLLPILYLPGMTPVGRWVYAQIAERRKRCSHKSCSL